MKPIAHPSNTRELAAPPAWDHSGLPVEPLGITDETMGGVPCMWSFWRPDAEELAALAAGGYVVLSVVGRTMPPVAVMVGTDGSIEATPASLEGYEFGLPGRDRALRTPRLASKDPGHPLDTGERSVPPSTQRYDDTLLPFLALMRAELHANTAKGDRPGWLRMSREVGLLEIYWHAAKLSTAVKHNNLALIREHAADVANMAMMLLDVCGGLIQDTPLQTGEADAT